MEGKEGGGESEEGRIRNARKYGEGLIVAGWDPLQLIEGGARRILRTPPGAWRPTAGSVFRYLCCWIQGARGVQECPPKRDSARWLLIMPDPRTLETVPTRARLAPTTYLRGWNVFPSLSLPSKGTRLRKESLSSDISKGRGINQDRMPFSPILYSPDHLNLRKIAIFARVSVSRSSVTLRGRRRRIFRWHTRTLGIINEKKTLEEGSR